MELEARMMTAEYGQWPDSESCMISTYGYFEGECSIGQKSDWWDIQRMSELSPSFAANLCT